VSITSTPRLTHCNALSNIIKFHLMINQSYIYIYIYIHGMINNFKKMLTTKNI
jgi:hypothetical protein